MSKIRRIVQWAAFLIFLTGFIGIAWSPLNNLSRTIVTLQFFPALIRLSVVIPVILLLTLLAGRFYCSTLCPLATVQDLCKKRSQRFIFRRPNIYLRFTIPVLSLILLVAGFPAFASIVDPFSSAGRIALAVNDLAIVPLHNLAALIFRQFSVYISANPIEIKWPAIISAALTLGAVFLISRLRGRLFCNSLCPVGALLSIPARWAVFSPRIDPVKCTACGACEKICKAEAADSSSKMIDTSRCVSCFDCLPACKFDALRFGAKPKRLRKPATSLPDNERREFLKKSALGSLLLFTAPGWANSIDTNGPKAKTTPAIPPGAQNLGRFLSKCTACALCISHCPGHVLQPASFVPYGAKGFGVPFMDFNRGVCEYECTLCTNLCPSDAIFPLDLEQKKVVKIGETEFVRKYCIVETDETSCGACGEICPTGAIEMVHIGEGSDGALEIPIVDNDYCIGCGACQYVCPVPAKNTIFVKPLDRHQTAKQQDEAESVDPEDVDSGFAF